MPDAAERVREIGRQTLRTNISMPDSVYHCRSDMEGSTSKKLVVGDSHTWLSGCSTAYPTWDVDCLPGRTSPMGVEIVKELLAPRHKELVFDLATNDRFTTNLQLEALRQVWDLIGPKRVLTLVTSYTQSWPIGSNTATPANNVIMDFAKKHPNRVNVVKWHQICKDHPEYFSADRVHFTGTGYAARVITVAAGAIAG